MRAFHVGGAGSGPVYRRSARFRARRTRCCRGDPVSWGRCRVPSGGGVRGVGRSSSRPRAPIRPGTPLQAPPAQALPIFLTRIAREVPPLATKGGLKGCRPSIRAGRIQFEAPCPLSKGGEDVGASLRPASNFSRPASARKLKGAARACAAPVIEPVCGQLVRTTGGWCVASRRGGAPPRSPGGLQVRHARPVDRQGPEYGVAINRRREKRAVSAISALLSDSSGDFETRDTTGQGRCSRSHVF